PAPSARAPVSQDGRHVLFDVLQARVLEQERRRENTHAWPRQRGQDDHPVPAANRRGGVDHPDDRLQRRDSDVQEHQVSGVGLGRSNVDSHRDGWTNACLILVGAMLQSVLEMLLRQYGGDHLCDRRLRHATAGNGQGGAAGDAVRGRAQGLEAAPVRQQAGSTGRARRGPGEREARTERAQGPPMVYTQVLRHKRRRSRGGARLARDDASIQVTGRKTLIPVRSGLYRCTSPNHHHRIRGL
ncbi:hypothetical protein Golomagni_07006, partial [Golovinomyces magnicellulatus]